jgi:hypothetical protein
MSRTVHMAPILRRMRPLLTPKAQNSNHYISRTGSKMRSGQYAASPGRSDARGRVVRRFNPGSITRGSACLTSVCVQGDLKAVIYGQARRVLETTFFA